MADFADQGWGSKTLNVNNCLLSWNLRESHYVQDNVQNVRYSNASTPIRVLRYEYHCTRDADTIEQGTLRHQRT